MSSALTATPASRTQRPQLAAAAVVRLAALWRSDELGLEVRLLDAPRQSHAWVMDRFGVMARATAERWWYRGVWQWASAGLPRLLEPNEVVQCQAEEESRRVLILFDDRTLQPAAPTSPWRVLGFAAVQAPALDVLLRPLLGAELTPWMMPAAADALLTALAPHYLRHGAPPAERASATRDGVTRARDFLLQEHTRLVSLEELSAVAQLSRFHLARRFSDEVGLPPHLFHLHVRIARARALLVEGGDLSSIAQATGFADQAHLTRWFTRVVGLSPGRYQRRGLPHRAAEAAS